MYCVCDFEAVFNLSRLTALGMVKYIWGFLSLPANHSVVVTPLTGDESVANFVVKTTNRTVIVIKATDLLGKAI